MMKHSKPSSSTPDYGTPEWEQALITAMERLAATHIQAQRDTVALAELLVRMAEKGSSSAA